MSEITFPFPDVELDPVLQACVYDEPGIGDGTWPVLKHPLVFSVPYTPQMNDMLNKSLANKRDALRAATIRKDWHSYVFLHERAYRIHALQDLLDHHDQMLYDHERDTWTPEGWDLIATVWIDSENIWQSAEVWDELLRHDSSEQMMDVDELAFVQGLPDKVEIHRGWSRPERQWGWSWTLDREKAVWFAKRFHEANARVTTITVHKSDITAYLSGRNESEILFDPEVAEETVEINTERVTG